MLALLIEPFNNPDLNRAAGLCLNTMNKQRETTHIAESSVLTTTLMLPHMILHHDTSEGLISISSSRCSGCRILTAFHLLYYWEFDRHGLTEVQQICPDHEFPAIPSGGIFESTSLDDGIWGGGEGTFTLLCLTSTRHYWQDRNIQDFEEGISIQ